MFNECRGEKRPVSLARLELAGLEKLGIVGLFTNFLRGVEKTFLPTKKRRLETTPIPSQTVFVVRPSPTANVSNPKSVLQGILTQWKGLLSTVDLLIKVAFFEIK